MISTWLVLNGSPGPILLVLLAIVFLVMPMVAGYIGAVFMEHRGRSRLLGFFLGAGLMLAGVIAYLVID